MSPRPTRIRTLVEQLAEQRFEQNLKRSIRIPARLLAPESRGRVEFGGAADRDIGGQESHDEKKEDNRNVQSRRTRDGRLREPADSSRRREAHPETGDQSSAYPDTRRAEDRPDDGAAVGAECDPDGNLSRALAHETGDNTVHAARGHD